MTFAYEKLEVWNRSVVVAVIDTVENISTDRRTRKE